MPQLIRLFYVSRATQKGVDQVITDILRVAREFNASNGITGILTSVSYTHLRAHET